MARKRKPKLVKYVTRVNIQKGDELIAPNHVLEMTEEAAEVYLHKRYVMRYQDWPEQWRDRLIEWNPPPEIGAENGTDN